MELKSSHGKMGN